VVGRCGVSHGWDYLSAVKRPIGGSLLSLGLAPLIVGDTTIATVAAFGAVSAEGMAAIIESKTGVRTTAADIVARAIRARAFAPGYGTATIEQKTSSALAGLASMFVDGGSPSDAATAIIPIINRFGLGKMLEVIRLANVLGMGDALLSAGKAIAGSMLQPIRDLVEAMSGLFDGVGGGGTFMAMVREISAAVGKAAGDVAEIMPIISAGYKLCSMAADLINSQLMLPDTTDRHANDFARDPLDLYLYLCRKQGIEFGGSWQAYFSPFFQETFVQNTNMAYPTNENMFAPVRAIDIGNYSIDGVRCPDWRATFSSETARLWMGGTFGDEYVPPGHSAALVHGCPCSSLEMRNLGTSPGLWSQRRPEFRAAALASCYISANIACVKGVGVWDGSVHAYVDQDRHYDLGIGSDHRKTTWFSRYRAADGLLVLPPQEIPEELFSGYPPSAWTDELRDAVAREGGTRCMAQPPRSDNTAWRTALAAFLGTRVGVGGGDDRWIPLSSASRYGIPNRSTRIRAIATERPLTATVRTVAPASSISPVVVIGGLSIAALAAWLALK
jgi:hypothetical protein